MVKNYIFDLGGVLIDVNQERSIEAFKQWGLSEADHWIGMYWQSGIFEELERGEISPEEFFHEIRSLTQSNISNEQIIKAWNAMLGDISSWKLELLLSLRKRFKVFLLSNTNLIHWETICNLQFSYKGLTAADFFDAIYLSYKLHLSKPSEEIFNMVLKNAGLESEETMLIDDSPANCKTAATLGLQTYCPKPNEDWRHLFE